MKKTDYYIGIDPGTKTGVSVWNVKERKFDFIKTYSILDALERLEIFLVLGKTVFVIENPNLRKWFGNTGRERLQGSGSIKRDFAIWKEWFTKHDAQFVEIAPKNVRTKLNSKTFQQITGFTEKTDQHGRDSAMMVYSLNNIP